MKLIALFLLHQIAATAGVLSVTVFCVFTVRKAIITVTSTENVPILRGIHWLMVGNPVFPVQIAMALWVGWRIYKFFPNSVMFWVWILPSLALTYAVFAIPTLSPWSASVLNQHSGSVSHYFGMGCRVDERCFDQLTLTLPFYTSVAYATGAWLGQRFVDPKG